MVEMGLAEAADLAEKINAVEIDHVFVMDGSVLGFRYVDAAGWYAPTVTNDPDGDISIDTPGWSALTGFTGQQGYAGAVMHPSEFIGIHIARWMSELSQDEPMTFVVTVVHDDAGEMEPIGWCVLYRENVEPGFKCLFPSE